MWQVVTTYSLLCRDRRFGQTYCSYFLKEWNFHITQWLKFKGTVKHWKEQPLAENDVSRRECFIFHSSVTIKMANFIQQNWQMCDTWRRARINQAVICFMKCRKIFLAQYAHLFNFYTQKGTSVFPFASRNLRKSRVKKQQNFAALVHHTFNQIRNTTVGIRDRKLMPSVNYTGWFFRY